jgi:hypothetical protein
MLRSPFRRPVRHVFVAFVHQPVSTRHRQQASQLHQWLSMVFHPQVDDPAPQAGSLASPLTTSKAADRFAPYIAAFALRRFKSNQEARSEVALGLFVRPGHGGANGGFPHQVGLQEQETAQEHGEIGCHHGVTFAASECSGHAALPSICPHVSQQARHRILSFCKGTQSEPPRVALMRRFARITVRCIFCNSARSRSRASDAVSRAELAQLLLLSA